MSMCHISICQPDLRNILQSVIARFLYREHINNMCGANTYLNELFTDDWRYVYRICLHHQPHNYDGPAICTNNRLFMYFDYRERPDTQSWYKEGRYHREGDQPAVIYADGTQEWCKEGLIHREGDLPAKIYPNGTQEWFQEGKRHRDGDQPAIIYANGNQVWWKEGRLCRWSSL